MKTTLIQQSADQVQWFSGKLRIIAIYGSKSRRISDPYAVWTTEPGAQVAQKLRAGLLFVCASGSRLDRLHRQILHAFRREHSLALQHRLPNLFGQILVIGQELLGIFPALTQTG